MRIVDVCLVSRVSRDLQRTAERPRQSQRDVRRRNRNDVSRILHVAEPAVHRIRRRRRLQALLPGGVEQKRVIVVAHFALQPHSGTPGWARLLGERTPCGKELRSKRSEEHTSELQSREKLVCRLLIEK